MKKAFKKKAVRKQQRDCEEARLDRCCNCVYDPCGCYSACCCC